MIVLPPLSLKKPKILSEGSNLEKIDSGSKRNFTIISLFFGLSSFFLGLIITRSMFATLEPHLIIEDVEMIMSEFQATGGLAWEQAIMFLGLLLLGLGILLFVLAILITIGARIKKFRDGIG